MDITKSHPKYRYAQVLKEESEYKYYILGFIAADGYVSVESNRCEIALKEADVNFLEYIKDIIVPEKKLKYKQAQKAYRLTIDSAEFVECISKYMICKDKSLYLTFPTNIPNEYIRHFIRGYMDGDGCIDLYKRYKRINGERVISGGTTRLRILGTKAFLLGLVQVLKYSNITNYDIIPQKKRIENVYYLSWVGASAERILDWLYNDSIIFLPRKRAVYNIIKSSDSQKLLEDVTSGITDYNTRMSEFYSDKDIVDSLIRLSK